MRGTQKGTPMRRSPGISSWTPYLFLLPALVMLGVFWVVPALMAVASSWTNLDLSSGIQVTWVGWEHYRSLLGDPVFQKAVVNSWLYLVGVVPPLVLLPLVLAILVRPTRPWILPFRGALYLPVIVPMVVVGLTWKWLYAEQGLVNALIQGALPGILARPLPWLGLPETALMAVMFVTVWKGLGYYMMVYLAGLQAIPADLYESADLDGAGLFRRHLSITIPLMAPTMGLVGLMSCISALKVFAEIWVLTRGGPLDSSTTVVFDLYQRFTQLDFGPASAEGMILFAMTLVFSVTNQVLTGRMREA